MALSQRPTAFGLTGSSTRDRLIHQRIGQGSLWAFSALGVVALLVVGTLLGSAAATPAPQPTPAPTAALVSTAIPSTSTPVVITATPRPTEPSTATPRPTRTPVPSPTATETPLPTPYVLTWCIATGQQWLYSSPGEDPRFHAGFVRAGESVGILQERSPAFSDGDWAKVILRRGGAETRAWARLAWLACP